MSDQRTGIGLDGLLPDSMEDGLKTWFQRGTGGLLLVVAAVGWAALATWSIHDPALANGAGLFARNMLGRPGALFADLLMQSLGLAAVAALFAPTYWATDLVLGRRPPPVGRRLTCWPAAVLALAGAISMLPAPTGWPLKRGLGGVVGDLVEDLALQPLERFDHWMAASLAFAVLAGAGLALLSRALGVNVVGLLWSRGLAYDPDTDVEDDEPRISQPFGSDHADGGNLPYASRTFQPAPSQSFSLDDPIGPIEPEFEALPRILMPPPAAHEQPAPQPRRAPRLPQASFEASAAFARLHESLPADPESFAMAQRFAPAPPVSPEAATPRQSQATPARQPAAPEASGYQLPSLLALKQPAKPRHDADRSPASLKGQSRLLEDALAEFGVKGKIVRSVPGPVVTLHELETARGINPARVIALGDDIAAAMDAGSVRIAAIPASDRIGIEVPNTRRDIIAVRSMLEVDAYRRSTATLPLALGRAMDGEPMVADLARLPHLLVVGAAGSGKSVTLQTLMLSLLFKHTPDRLRLVLIDPAMRELAAFGSIPHLIGPVAGDWRRAASYLSWAAAEQDERSKQMAQIDASSIETYNTKLHNARRQGTSLAKTVQTGFDRVTGEARYERATLDLEPMPYMVIVISELAALMHGAPRETEAVVKKLAKGGQSAGIHLIAATRHTSPDVLSGPILAAMASRLCLRAGSKAESAVVLGDHGAEQLLGAGDMIYAMSSGRSIRIHGALVTPEDVIEVVRDLSRQAPPAQATRRPQPQPQPEAPRQSDRAALLEQAIACIRQDRVATASHLQKQLGIPHLMAQDLIAQMEARRLVTRPDSMGKRRICVN